MLAGSNLGLFLIVVGPVLICFNDVEYLPELGWRNGTAAEFRLVVNWHFSLCSLLVAGFWVDGIAVDWYCMCAFFSWASILHLTSVIGSFDLRCGLPLFWIGFFFDKLRNDKSTYKQVKRVNITVGGVSPSAVYRIMGSYGSINIGEQV